MFTIKKTILSIAAVASSVILLSSCGSSEIVNPNLASEIGEANVTGKFLVNTDESNDLKTFTGTSVTTVSGTTSGTSFSTTVLGVTSYENNFPTGKVFLTVTYNQSSVNPVPASAGSPAAVLKKALVVPVAADGTYSFKVPASGRGTVISVKVNKFEADVTSQTSELLPGATDKSITTIVKKYSFSADGWAVTDMPVYVGENTLPLGTFVKGNQL